MKKWLMGLGAVLFSASVFASGINLNTATSEQLQTLNGIGPAKAKAIIEYREKHGAFKSIDDLDRVPGFGQKSVEKLRSDLTVAPPAAVKAVKPMTAAGAKQAVEKKASDKAVEMMKK